MPYAAVLGRIGHGKAGAARRGMLRRVEACYGTARQAWRVKAWPVRARHDLARPGKAGWKLR